MELEEMKSMWTAMDNRLKKHELLKESMVKETIRDRSDKSLSKLLNFDLFSLILLFLALPLNVYMYLYLEPFRALAGGWFCYTLCLVVAYGIAGGFVHLYYLTKMDFMADVGHNLRYINKYNVLYRKEKILSVPIIGVMFFFGIYHYASIHANAFLWTFLACTYISCTVFVVFAYRRIYDKHIANIRRSLEDLKELDGK
ncbi:MAG: hypothetical protein LBD27_00285 [Tannerella sp.]|jgi:hypothetical protein|nr:hypothetical protein [Tannerella sp.]